MIFTEEILRQLIALAILKASKSLDIVNAEESDFPENAMELIALSPDHHQAVKEFVEAYEDWFKFHLGIYKAGKSGNLSTSETEELTSLIKRRDAAREALREITN